MTPLNAEDARRVLIYAPIGRDAALTHSLLEQAGLRSVVCPSAEAVCAGIEEGAAALVLTEEIFELGDFERIADALRNQPPWSDIPVLLFGAQEGRPGSPLTLAAFERLPNVTLLDRPVRISVAISLVRAAIRARARQLQVRDLLAALDASRQQAEDANRLKDEFLATLSHELRTPLNAILGWTAMLQQAQLDPAQARRGLQIIDRNARAQAQLVEDVLDMARIITGKLRVDFRRMTLEATLDGAVEALRPAAEAKQINVELHRAAEPTVVRGDADRLQQVFWNILSNAVKFTPEGGHLTVRAVRQGPQVVVTIADTGIGMSPDFLPYVFDRFRQADQTVTRGHGGLGIGLALVKHLVELHGGSVRASSPGIGQGATFTVVLPVLAAHSGEAEASSGTAGVDRMAATLPRGTTSL